MAAQHVYFLRPVGQDGPVKIGCSTYVGLRFATFLSWSPVALEIAVSIPGDKDLERRLHLMFASSHSHMEWFHATPDLTQLIERLRAGEDVTTLVDMVRPIDFKRTLTEREHRQRRYSSRLHWAFESLRRSGAEFHYKPERVEAIQSRWRGFDGATPQEPTLEEFAYLDAVLANPAAYAEACVEDDQGAAA